MHVQSCCFFSLPSRRRIVKSLVSDWDAARVLGTFACSNFAKKNIFYKRQLAVYIAVNWKRLLRRLIERLARK